MANRDFQNNIEGNVSISPAVITASANGTGVDCQNADAVAIIVNTGTYTDGSHVITLEESDDDATYTDVADTDILGTEPTIDAVGDADSVFKFGYIGNKRYVRAVTTVAGATSGAAYGVTVVEHKLARTPADFSVTS